VPAAPGGGTTGALNGDTQYLTSTGFAGIGLQGVVQQQEALPPLQAQY